VFQVQTLNCLGLKIKTQNYIVHKKRNVMLQHILDCIRIESTDKDFGIHEKVVIPITIVTYTLPIPIPIFGIFVFPFPMGILRERESYSHAHLYISLVGPC